jgi:hypothetical protein
MFVRFRQTPRRLQASLVETRRRDGKVRHEHVASLGSVPAPPSVADRVAFWTALHERLARLANRLDAAAQAKVLGAVHGRVPMATAAEQRALQLANAEAEATLWDSMADLHAGTAADHKGLAASAAYTAAKGEAERATAAAKAARARDRIARINAGEDVAGGLGQPLSYERARRIRRDAGMSDSDVDHAELLHAVAEQFGEEKVISNMVDAGMKAKRRAEKAALRRLVREAKNRWTERATSVTRDDS